MNQTLTQIQEELYKEYKGKRIPANEGNGNIVIGQEFLDDIFNFVSIRVIEKVEEMVEETRKKYYKKWQGTDNSEEMYVIPEQVSSFANDIQSKLSTLIEQK